MKIEKEEYNAIFKNVKEGQCFKHITGGFYIKIHKSDDSTTNCIALDDGRQGVCSDIEKVRIFGDAKIVLGG